MSQVVLGKVKYCSSLRRYSEQVPSPVPLPQGVDVYNIHRCELHNQVTETSQTNLLYCFK